jgi:hypothetical protein
MGCRPCLEARSKVCPSGKKNLQQRLHLRQFGTKLPSRALHSRERLCLSHCLSFCLSCWPQVSVLRSAGTPSV